jgi:hypothetical protein
MSGFQRRFLNPWLIFAIAIASASPCPDAPAAVLLVGAGAGTAGEDEFVKVENSIAPASTPGATRCEPTRVGRCIVVVGRLPSHTPNRGVRRDASQGPSCPLRVQLCRLTC